MAALACVFRNGAGKLHPIARESPITYQFVTGLMLPEAGPANGRSQSTMRPLRKITDVSQARSFGRSSSMSTTRPKQIRFQISSDASAKQQRGGEAVDKLHQQVLKRTRWLHFDDTLKF
jgi:hypothetical protein